MNPFNGRLTTGLPACQVFSTSIGRKRSTNHRNHSQPGSEGQSGRGAFRGRLGLSDLALQGRDPGLVTDRHPEKRGHPDVVSDS